MNIYTLPFIGWLATCALVVLFIYAASPRRTYTPAEHEAELQEQAEYLDRYQPSRRPWIGAVAVLFVWGMLFGVLEKVSL